MSLPLKRKNDISKCLSFWLRHEIGNIDLGKNEYGFVQFDDLLNAISTSKKPVQLTLDEVKQLIAEDERNRFELLPDNRIRANYGHSFEVEHFVGVVDTPKFLFITVPKGMVPAIEVDGITLKTRKHAYLFESKEQAENKQSDTTEYATVLIRSGQMEADGFQFMKLESDVWVTESHIEPQYINVGATELKRTPGSEP